MAFSHATMTSRPSRTCSRWLEQIPWVVAGFSDGSHSPRSPGWPSRSHQAQTTFTHPPLRPHRVAPETLLHDLAEGGGRSLGFLYQAIRVLRQVVSLCYELTRGVTRCPGAQPQFRRKDRATEQMATNAFGQVDATTRTQMYTMVEKVSPKLGLAKAPGARDALRDRMVPAIPEEDCALLRTQTTRSATVDVGHQTSADVNGILAGNHLQASRALRFRHSCTLMRRRPLINDAFDQLM